MTASIPNPLPIQRQIRLPLSKAVEIAYKSIRLRLARSLLVTSGIVLALAFLMSILSTDAIIASMGVTPERLSELARQAFAWALPNVLLGALIIVPIWFLAFLFRPPGTNN